MTQRLVTQIEASNTYAKAVQPIFAAGLSFRSGLMVWVTMINITKYMITQIAINMLIVALIVLGISWLLGKFPPGHLIQTFSLKIGWWSRSNAVLGGLASLLDSGITTINKTLPSPTGLNSVFEP